MAKVLGAFLACVILTYFTPPFGFASTGSNALIYKGLTDQVSQGETWEVSIAGVRSPFSLISAFVLPGETLVFHALGEKSTVTARAQAGRLRTYSRGYWGWRAPSHPGRHDIVVEDAGGRRVTLRVFVMEPYHNEAVFHGFRVGEYEPPRDDGNSKYDIPRGMVRVTEANQEVRVSPNFKLREFLCKQTGDPTRFVVLQTSLLVKLELLREELNQELGREVRLHVMSGYRTPRYNKAIGNVTLYSRHLYGDAADVFVDVDGNEMMDDLNGDGRITVEDAGIMYSVADHMHEFVGGVGIYGPKPSIRGPFIHVDTRGHHERWDDKRSREWFANYNRGKSRDLSVVE